MSEAGPCIGHVCDGCRTCSRGRCCRRDVPDYRLPDLGAWDGPIHGTLGVLELISVPNGERLICHACGGEYEFLGGHVGQAHDLTATEYRSIFGLKASTGLTVPRLKVVHSQLGQQAVELMRERGTLGTTLPTPEQTSQIWKGRKRSLEESLKNQEQRKTAGQRLAARVASGEIVLPNRTGAGQAGARAVWQQYQDDPAKQRAFREAQLAARGLSLARFACSICNGVFEAASSSRRKTCGADICKQEANRRAARQNQKIAVERMKHDPEARAQWLEKRRAPQPQRRVERVRLLCRQCGMPFLVIPSRVGKATTCSRACAQAVRMAAMRAHPLTDNGRARISEAKRQYHAARRAAKA